MDYFKSCPQPIPERLWTVGTLKRGVILIHVAEVQSQSEQTSRIAAAFGADFSWAFQRDDCNIKAFVCFSYM